MVKRWLSVFLVICCFGTSLAEAATTSEDAIAAEVVRQVNRWRSQHHLKPLAMNAMMSREALAHSRAMATHSLPFGHQGFQKRIARIYQKAKNPQSGSENVAYNYKSAEDVVRNWLTSSGHRRNIAGNFNETGVGVVRDSSGKLWFTQIFLRNA